MTTEYSTYLGLALPVQGELAGTWGDTVNNGITQYSDISIAGTLTLNGDGAVELVKTNGTSAGTNIGSTTAQYAVLKITGTTTTKVITAPSSSKTYTVINASSYGVTVKASGQTGVTVAAGEKAYVAFNGTDYVTIAGSAADGVTSVSGTGTVNGITLTGTVTSTGSLTLGGSLSGVNLTSQVTGTLPVPNGGLGVATLTANSVVLGNGTSAVQTVAPGTTGNVLTSDGTTWSSQAPAASGISAGKSIAFDLIFAI